MIVILTKDQEEQLISATSSNTLREYRSVVKELKNMEAMVKVMEVKKNHLQEQVTGYHQHLGGHLLPVAEKNIRKRYDDTMQELNNLNTGLQDVQCLYSQQCDNLKTLLEGYGVI